MDDTIKTVEKTNNIVVNFFRNPIIKYGFLILAVFRIIFINSIDDSYLNLLNNTWVKVIYALLIAYAACFDPIYAIILTTLLVISIQELYSRQAKRGLAKSIPFNPAKPINTDILVSPQSVSMVDKDIKAAAAEVLITDKMVYDQINQRVLQRTPASGDSLIAEYDYYQDPAFKTITANLKDKESKYLGCNMFYTTAADMAMIQTNQADKNINNQGQPIQVFASNTMNAQGLPMGFDKGVGGANPEFASVGSA
jgi:hypothetical protein